MGLRSSLDDLAAKGDHRGLGRLLNRGADANKAASTPGKLGRLPLHASAASGHLKAVEVLLEFGALLDARDEAGETPLHYVSKTQHVPVATALLLNGADHTIRSHAGKLPTHLAADAGQVAMQERLRQQAVDCPVEFCFFEGGQWKPYDSAAGQALGFELGEGVQSAALACDLAGAVYLVDFVKQIQINALSLFTKSIRWRVLPSGAWNTPPAPSQGLHPGSQDPSLLSPYIDLLSTLCECGHNVAAPTLPLPELHPPPGPASVPLALPPAPSAVHVAPPPSAPPLLWPPEGPPSGVHGATQQRRPEDRIGSVPAAVGASGGPTWEVLRSVEEPPPRTVGGSGAQLATGDRVLGGSTCDPFSQISPPHRLAFSWGGVASPRPSAPPLPAGGPSPPPHDAEPLASSGAPSLSVGTQRLFLPTFAHQQSLVAAVGRGPDMRSGGGLQEPPLALPPERSQTPLIDLDFNAGAPLRRSDDLLKPLIDFGLDSFLLPILPPMPAVAPPPPPSRPPPLVPSTSCREHAIQAHFIPPPSPSSEPPSRPPPPIPCALSAISATTIQDVHIALAVELPTGAGPRSAIWPLVSGSLEYNEIAARFLYGMERERRRSAAPPGSPPQGSSQVLRPITVTAVHTVRVAPGRLRAFEAERAALCALRGSANEALAWHGAPLGSLAGIVKVGFRVSGRATNGHLYGAGVYLAPEGRAYNSAEFAAPDGSGEKHVLLCRVLLGMLEAVAFDSDQSAPSGAASDSGVDQLAEPSRYVVWAAKVNERVLPTHVVSFRYC